jgi:hypothetical protein
MAGIKNSGDALAPQLQLDAQRGDPTLLYEIAKFINEGREAYGCPDTDSAEKERAPKTSPGEQVRPDVQTLMGMCRSFSDTEGNTLDWQRAVKACSGVLTADPINADARTLERLSKQELAEKDIFERAHELFGLGQEEAAMQEFDKLDGKSFYFAQGHSDFRKAAEVAKKRDGDACLSSDSVGEYETAWISCKKYEDIGCYQGVEDKYQRVFNALQLRFKGKDTWTCPDKYKRWLGA